MLSQDEVECEYTVDENKRKNAWRSPLNPNLRRQVKSFILVTTWWEFGGLRCWPAKNMGELSPAQPVPSSWVQNLPSELSKLWQNSLKKWTTWTTWTTAIYTFLRSNTRSHTVNSGCWPLAMLWRQTRNDWLEHLWEHPSYWPWQRDMLQREAHLNFLNASYCSKWSWPDLPQSLSVGAHLGWMEYDGICWNHQTPCKQCIWLFSIQWLYNQHLLTRSTSFGIISITSIGGALKHVRKCKHDIGGSFRFQTWLAKSLQIWSVSWRALNGCLTVSHTCLERPTLSATFTFIGREEAQFWWANERCTKVSISTLGLEVKRGLGPILAWHVPWDQNPLEACVASAKDARQDKCVGWHLIDRTGT